jgi:hypothetical protein
MKLSDPATWPKYTHLFYRKISSAHPTAHAFYANSSTSLCNGISRDPTRNVPPTAGYCRLCSHCIGDLRAWGYLSRSEVVEET